MFRTARIFARFSPSLSASARSSQRRQISLFRRHEQQHENTQRVRIFDAITKRRIAYDLLRLSGTIAFGYWLLFHQLDLKIEIAEDDEKSRGNAEQRNGPAIPGQQVGPEAGDEEFEPDEDAIFLPLTIPKQLPREFYRGSDPEWQEFKKVAADKGRLGKIYEELGEAAFQAISQSPECARLMGKNGKKRKYWFDTTYPYGPPQDYGRKGIEFGSSYIAISEERLTPEEYARMSRILWPVGTAESVYRFWHTLWTFQWQKIKATLGLDTSVQPGSKEHALNHALKMVKAREAMQNAEAASSAQFPGGQAGDRPHPTSVSQTEGRKGPTERPIEANPSDNNSSWLIPSTLGQSLKTPETKVANAIFISTMKKNATLTEKEPPRGSFQILGMITVAGDTSSLLFSVRAHYDPKVNKFANVELGLMSVKPWKQVPRGGP